MLDMSTLTLILTHLSGADVRDSIWGAGVPETTPEDSCVSPQLSEHISSELSFFL